MGDLGLLSEPIFTSLGRFTFTGFFCSFSTTSTLDCSEDIVITNSVVLHCDSETRSVREPRQSKSDCFQMNYENPARREREDRENGERPESFSIDSPSSLRLGWSCLCLMSGQTKSSAWGEIPAKQARNRPI